MEITLFQGVLITLMAFVIGMDFYLEAFFWFRPIIAGTLTGIILGDVQTGIIGGGMAELAFAGMTPAGGSSPPNPVMAGIMTPVLAYTTGVDVTQALALALPFSFLGQYIVLMFWTGFSLLMPKLDKYAAEGDTKGFERLTLGSLVFVGLIYAILVFLSVYLAQDLMRELVSLMPAWLSHGFEVLGGILPGIGFAMLLNVMLQVWLIPYLLIGFVMATFGNFSNLLPVAVIGTALAGFEYTRLVHEEKKNSNTGGTNNGI